MVNEFRLLRSRRAELPSGSVIRVASSSSVAHCLLRPPQHLMRSYHAPARHTDMTAKSAADKFIDELMVDRDPYAAATRAGVASVALRSMVQKWARDPAIQRKIQERTLALDPKTMVSPQWIIAKLQELASSRYATPTAATSALRELAHITGLHPKELSAKGAAKLRDPNGQRRGMLVVPGDAPMEVWEEQTVAQQRTLKEEIRK